MTDSKPDGSGAETPRGKSILGVVCVLVAVVYACAAHPGIPLSGKMSAADNYYNLLMEGFRAGQLSLKVVVPHAFTQLADPYDPSAHAPYSQQLGDMSYYKGKLYLYFGATPAVLLFWPYVTLSGHYLLQRDAVVIFCLVGFLISVGLLGALWRRYFAHVVVAVVAAGALALGLAAGVPIMLARSDVYEVSISCGYMLMMLTLAAVWKALHQPERQCRWLAAAGLAYGLAVGARPNLVFGAVLLLVPVFQALRERRAVLAPLLAAMSPIMLIGLGLMLYNALRFDSPFEFGPRYQLAGEPPHLTQEFFSLRYLWLNLRVYFLKPALWNGRYPLVQDDTSALLPAGHGPLERTFGVLTNIPLVWLAVAVPLAWRNRSVEACSALCGFLAAVATLFGISTLTLGLFSYTAGRYETEFLPPLVLLAVVGILSAERTVAPTSESGLASRPVCRRAVRWVWSLLLGFSVAFNLLACVGRCAEWHDDLGIMLGRQGRVQEAIGQYEQALRLNPDFAEAHYNFGVALSGQGKLQEEIGQYEQALRIKPEYADAHNNLGVALRDLGRPQEAIGHYEQALRLNPDCAEAHINWGSALLDQGRLQEAIGQYKQALRIKPEYADAHFNLGIALEKLRRTPEAIEHYEQALRLNPDDAEAHFNLGIALEKLRRTPEAIEHYEQALRLNPDYAKAHFNLGLALARTGKVQEAIEHWEQTLRLIPDYAEAHYNLGLAFKKQGRTQEAIQQYEQALRIKPDFIQAQNALARARAAQ
jgi:tetratricopeptide (TPR) repeat protein